MTPTLVLGIDGGGTRTRAMVVDQDGRFLGQGVGGPSNYDDVGVAATRASIEKAIAAARRATAVPDAPFAAAFLGMAGVVSPADRAVIARIARELDLAPDDKIGIDHDCRIALAGGLGGRPGMVQIVGTGSSTYGINANGETWRAGGWGQLISDEGSGYWLGVQALQTAVRVHDGRLPHSSLLPKIQDRLQVAHMDDIMHRIYGAPLSRADIAALAPLVVEAAREGDTAAVDIIDLGAGLLADCVIAVAERLGFDSRPSELALAGGMFSAGEVFTQPFVDKVTVRLPDCQIIPAELPPVVGACVLSLQQLGIQVDGPISEALYRTKAYVDQI